ncbi:MAG: hypothetical protein NVV73_00675 [Cellvibrionaceae bacterium]|nr:hypothetical protein [Cellvibrionaceae bacterium]
MKRYSKLTLVLGALLLTAACEVERTEDGEKMKVNISGGQLPKYEIRKTQEGQLPDVDVDAGKLPKYDVDGPEVNVGSETREVTVPTVDIDLPPDDDKEVNRGISASERDE